LEAVRSGAADIGLAAYDPSRAEGLTFSPPYLLSLNRYAVRNGSAIKSPDQVDRAGVKVAAVPTDTGGLYLKRTLKTAAQVPVATAEDGVALLKSGAVDVLATNGQRLADLQGAGGYTILPGSFFDVPQVIAVRADNTGLAATVAAEVKAMLASGAVARSVARWNLTGAAPAPLAP
jgi:polar amino acid transport system substrate-binding protein